MSIIKQNVSDYYHHTGFIFCNDGVWISDGCLNTMLWVAVVMIVGCSISVTIRRACRYGAEAALVRSQARANWFEVEYDKMRAEIKAATKSPERDKLQTAVEIANAKLRELDDDD